LHVADAAYLTVYTFLFLKKEIMNDFEMIILTEEERLLSVTGCDASSKADQSDGERKSSKQQITSENNQKADNFRKRKHVSSEQGISKKAWRLSNKKVVGARVLVKWSGNQSYWGLITQVSGYSPNATYSVSCIAMNS
jgi:hypothetical protein